MLPLLLELLYTNKLPQIEFNTKILDENLNLAGMLHVTHRIAYLGAVNLVM